MLNFRLLYILISPRSIRTYLGIIATLGFGVLLDIILFLKMSLMVGPWITMAVLAANTAIGVFIMYRLTELRGRGLVETIDDGHFDPDLFSRYLSTLVASLLLIVNSPPSTITCAQIALIFCSIYLNPSQQIGAAKSPTAQSHS